MKVIKMQVKRKNSIDFCLLFTMLILVVIGAVFVYSASSYSASLQLKDSFYYLKKQIIGIVLGLISCVAFSFIDYKKLEKTKYVLAILSIVLLVLVFIPKIGTSKYGARRWINLGFFTVQPSEIAKFALIIFAAGYMSKNATKVHTFRGILPVILLGIVFCGLIIMEPNMSITMCMGLLLLFMLYIGGASFKHLLMLIIPLIVAVPLLIVVEPYRMKRLLAFLDPWAESSSTGYQLVQSLYALGSGGLFGVGLFNSRQKYLFLPFAESDFIFSIIGEELGFLGCVLVLILFVMLIYRIIKIACNASTRFGSLLASGIASIIGIQVLLNVAVVTGSIPPTGLPLPFMSAGSTSLLVFMSAIGLVLNIDRQNKKEKI